MERVNNRRAVALIGIVAAILLAFAWRLFRLQIIDTNGNTDNTTTFTTWTRVKAARGEILDRNGNILVGNRASYDLVFNHYVIISSKDTNNSLRKLTDKCAELGVTYNDHFPVTKTRPFEYTIDDYSTAWRNYFQKFMGKNWLDLDSDITAPLLIAHLRKTYKIPDEWTDEEARAVIGMRYELDLRNVTNLSTYVFIEDVESDVLSALLELNTPGLMVEASTVREYHTKYAAHILGYMGAMDPSDWEIYKTKGYAMDAVIGQSGFEEAFEELLHAKDGTRVDVVDKAGTILSQKYKEGEEPIAGNNVETTIDLELQMVAEDALERIMTQLTDPDKEHMQNVYEGQDAAGAAVVVMSVKTGEVLACASYPTFDLATMKDNFAQIEEMPFDPMYNRALQGAYPPGSIYKMTTLTAAFNAGVANLETEIRDEGVFTKYDGFTPTCLAWSSNRYTHGVIDCKKALEVSCNYFFYELGDRVTIEQLDATAKGFGLGEHTGIELPEAVGHRSNPESKKAEYKGLNAQWFTGDRILTAIGQSENRFTPMQLAVYACTLANRGTRYKATFLSRVVSSDYREKVFENKPEIMSTMDICVDAYIGYMDGMRQVITGVLGTGRAYFGGREDKYNDRNGVWPYKDVEVCAKTGTAETFKNVSDNGSYICFAPKNNPEIAVAIYGEKVAHGSTMATVAEDVLATYFARYKTSDAVTYENMIG